MATKAEVEARAQAFAAAAVRSIADRGGTRAAPTAEPPIVIPGAAHTVWGLDPSQLHARFWAARGIQVVRQGEPSEIVPHAELFLLTDRRTMALFRLREVIEQLAWLDCEVLLVRLSDRRDRGYREVALTDDHGRFLKFRREYGGADTRLARVALTPKQDVARFWQGCASAREGWRTLRRRVPRDERWTMSVRGRVYDRSSAGEVASFVKDLVATWAEPDSTIDGISEVAPRVWAPVGTPPPEEGKVVGPLWIGSGRSVDGAKRPIGPAALWDDPESRPVPRDIRWLELQPSEPPTFHPRKPKAKVSLALRRAFDVVFAAGALAATLPLYPIIAAAIYIEDPGPIFFVHKRESKGGRTFGCIKFRSMRTDAEQIKINLAAQNKADGPQFFMEHDPRVTRVGAVLRKLQLDELPQFINVLRGEMSVVGPRPSPYSENQYCPPWREARLSVKPGVTGLWQVMRTRATGTDFQEWIKYDIEYVERQSFRLDLWIIWRTVLLIAKRVIRS